jgi:hypothetical protein
MTILFAFGVESMAKAHPKPASALLAALLAGSLYADVNWFLRPRENWKAAATDLESAAAQGACIVFAPSNFEIYYTFFSPGLSASKCPPGPLPPARRIAVAVSPNADLTALQAQGLAPSPGNLPPTPYVREFSTR